MLCLGVEVLRLGVAVLRLGVEVLRLGVAKTSREGSQVQLGVKTSAYAEVYA